jgi:hypothetical protein
MTAVYDDANGNGAATGERKLSCHAMVGKDEDGLVWISLVAKDRPRIKFIFQLSDWHEIFHGDGTPYNAADASVLQALSIARSLRLVYGNLIGGFRVPKPQADRPAYAGKPAYQAKKPELAIDDDVFF